MSNLCNEIKEFIIANADTSYKAFTEPLIPNIDKDVIIGVRSPILKKYSKDLFKNKVGNKANFKENWYNSEVQEFINDLPHKYHEENYIHMTLLGMIKDIEIAIAEMDKFLPYITNWAICDTCIPKAFEKHPDIILEKVYEWISSENTYTIRFAIGVLMKLFLDESYEESQAERVAEIISDEYYINMMSAWYFATALAKQYDSAVKFIEAKILPVWVHNKSIQKAVESFRVTDEHKAYLKTLRIKAKK